MNRFLLKRIFVLLVTSNIIKNFSLRCNIITVCTFDGKELHESHKFRLILYVLQFQVISTLIDLVGFTSSDRISVLDQYLRNNTLLVDIPFNVLVSLVIDDIGSDTNGQIERIHLVEFLG